MQGSGSQARALEGSWPALPHERTWSGVALFGTSVSTAIATWCFLIGGYVAYYLPAAKGTVAMVAGSLIGILLILLATMPVATKYGIDSIAATKPQLGWRGSQLALFLLYTVVISWNCVLLVFLGRAGAEIFIATGLAGEGSRPLLVSGLGVAGVLVVWFCLRRGPGAMRDLGPFIAGGVLLLGLWILVLLVRNAGWSAIFAAKPSASSGSSLWDYTTGVEILIASVLSWWPYAGGMVRLVPSARTAKWPVIFGLGLPVSLVSIIGLWSGLVIPESGGDPTTYLVELGGLWAGVPALAFIAFANIGTTMVGVYVTALGLRQLDVVQRRTTWNQTIMITVLPALLVIVAIPNYFFEHIGTVLAFMGVLFAPMCGMQIADYYLLRRQRLDIGALYRRGAGTAYHFWGGINPIGIAALAAGFATYVYLLNPVTYTSHSPYEFMTASLPSALVSAAVYAIGTRLLVIPARRGGYGRAREETAGPAPKAAPGLPEPAPSPPGEPVG